METKFNCNVTDPTHLAHSEHHTVPLVVAAQTIHLCIENVQAPCTMSTHTVPCLAAARECVAAVVPSMLAAA